MTVLVGIIVNPISGIGGAAGFKGSDEADIQQQAISQGYEPRSPKRVARFLDAIAEIKEQVSFYAAPGSMGGQWLAEKGFLYQEVGQIEGETKAADTTRIAAEMASLKPHLIMFVGGDGTAIDVFEGVGSSQLVLGVPAGVKMHSGVYANTPEDAAAIVRRMVQDSWLNAELAEVRDIDESSFRENRVVTQHYGEMLVPRDERWLQAVKCSGREQEGLVLEDLASWIEETSQDYGYEIVGPGSTTMAYLQRLRVDGTLLGVDIVSGGELVKKDASEAELLAFIEEADGQSARIIVTAIAGQGHILGRGNQQISARVIKKIGLESLTVVSTRSKLDELEGKPLQVDLDDVELVRQFPRMLKVYCGYDDAVVMPLKVES